MQAFPRAGILLALVLVTAYARLALPQAQAPQQWRRRPGKP